MEVPLYTENKLMVQQCIENIMNIQEAYMYIHCHVTSVTAVPGLIPLNSHTQCLRLPSKIKSSFVTTDVTVSATAFRHMLLITLLLGNN